MNNPEYIETMSGPEVQELAARLAVQLCETDAFKTDLAARLGCTRAAVNRWFSEGNRPPTIVLLYLEAELRRKAAEMVLEGLNKSLDAIRHYA